MSQMLPYDEIEIWYGHPDFYLNNLEEILNTPHDADTGYFVEVDLKHSDDKKQKPKIFPLAPKNKVVPKDKFNDYMK